MQKSHHTIYILLAVIVLLAGCTPAAAPTPSPEEVANQVATSVALTVQAKDSMATAVAETVQAQLPTEEPTATQAPPTVTPVLPTATPIVIVPPTSSGGGGGGPTKPEYACDFIHKRPFDNSEYRPNDPFDIRFTIVNTGTATWATGKDLVFLSGTNMAPAFATLQLPEMKPGATFDVGPYDAFAPSASGKYVMAFKLEGGFCFPYVAIIVK